MKHGAIRIISGGTVNCHEDIGIIKIKREQDVVRGLSSEDK